MSSYDDQTRTQYVNFIFGVNGNFMNLMVLFLTWDSNLARDIITNRKNLFLGCVKIPNKRSTAIRTKNFDELVEYVSRYPHKEWCIQHCKKKLDESKFRCVS